MKLPVLAKIALFSGTAALVCGLGSTARADYSSTVLGLNPLAYYHLDETTAPPNPDILVNSGSLGALANGYYIGVAGTDYTRPAGTSALPGSPDTAAQFVSPGYAAVPYVAGFNQQAFTAEGWFNPDTATASCIMSSVDFLASGRTGWILYYNVSAVWDLRMYTGLGTTFAAVIQTNAVAPGGTWYHIVVTSDGATATLYVNGDSLMSVPLVSYAPAPGAKFTICARSDNGYTTTSGTADEIAMYPTALSAAQVLAHYQNGTNAAPSQTYSSLVLADGATGYWRMDEPAYTPPDPSTYPVATNSGTLGSASTGTYEPGTAPGVAGVPFGGFPADNHAVQFNGILGGVNITNITLNTDTMTMAFWVKRNIFESVTGLVFQRPGGGGATGVFFVYDELCYDWNDDPNSYNWRSGLFLPEGTWSFVALVATPTNAVMFLNGAASTNQLERTAHDFGDGTPIYIGLDTLGGRVDSCTIDEVAFFNGALTLAQLQSLFNAGQVPPQISNLTRTPPDPVYEGSTVTMTVSAYGNPTLSYQWRKEGSPLTGKIANSVVFTNATASVSGNYDVVITNPSGSVTSSVVALSVIAGPPIVNQSPKSGSRYVGASAVFTPLIGGTTPITNQWYFNSNPIPGATDTTFTIPSVAFSDAGNYTLRLTNINGIAETTPAVLTVLPITSPYTKAVIAAKPDAYWRFNEPSGGTTAFDYVGGRDGVYVGGLVTGVAGPSYPGLESNNLSYAFNGTTAGVATQPPPILNTNTLSFIALVKRVGQQTSAAVIVNCRSGLPNDTFQYGMQGDGIDLQYDYYDDPLTWSFDPGFSPPDGSWGFVGITSDATNGVMYIDDDSGLGLQWSALAVDETNNLPMLGGINIGFDPAFATSRTWNGGIDEVAFFKRALSLDEMVTIYSALTNAPVVITISKTGPDWQLNWSTGTLQWVDDVIGGGWTDVPGAAPPSYTLVPTGTKKYFRVKVQ